MPDNSTDKPVPPLEDIQEVDFRVEPYPRYWDELRLIRDLAAGSDAMREGNYTPRLARETNKSYQERLKRTFLYPAISDTLNELSGRLFRRPVEIKKEAPEYFRSWMEDVDPEGNSLEIYLMNSLQDLHLPSMT